jgi:hypothetical protein
MSTTADEIRERLEAFRRRTRAEAMFREALDAGQFRAATEIAKGLGAQLSTHQVVPVDFRRARGLTTP